MIDTVYFIAFVLIFIRLFAFVQIVPVFYPSGTPNLVKATFPAIVAFIIMPGVDFTNISLIDNNFVLIVACISEVTTGLLLGFIVNLCFSCIRYAGSLMDMHVGFAMMTMFDPNANGSVTLIEKMMNWFTVITFLLIDGQ